MVVRVRSWIGKLVTLAERRFFLILSVVLVLGIAARLAMIVCTTSPLDPMNRLYPGFTDGPEYLDNARSLVETGVYGYGGRASAFRPPAYPLLMALSLMLFGETMTPLRLLHVVLSIGTIVCYTFVVLKHFGKLTAALTAFVFSIYPLFVFMTSEIGTESLYMALSSLIFAVTFRLLDDQEGAKSRFLLALAAGVLCGAGALTRPNMFLILVLLQALLVWRAFSGRARLWSWVIASVGLWSGSLLVMGPWLIRNHVRMGAPALTTNIDYNLFRGTFDLVAGFPGGRPITLFFTENRVIYEETIEDPAITRLPWGEVENERNARAAAVAIIRADPLLWFKERIKNALYLWLNLQWEPVLVEGRLLVVAAGASATLIYYAILGCAIAGSISIWRREVDPGRRRFVAVSWLFTLAAMSVVVTFVGKRYRVSMIDPYLVMPACVALASWMDRLRAPGGPEPARGAAAGVPI